MNGTRGDLVPGKVQPGYQNYHSLYLRKRDSWTQTNVALHVVIYDRQYSPFLYNQANQRYVPAESVYAVIEVKQDLSREHVRLR